MNVEHDWDSFWQGLTPESELFMKDFYGGRPWVLKHTPRFGKVVEAGCGLGRYVFYLSKLGIDIEGLDFHEATVKYLQQWTKDHGFSCSYRTGDVLNLPYESGTISAYLSFGVVEHFIEGPHRALAEVHRILRPGGIGIITTPSMSPLQRYFRFRRKCIDTVKQLMGKPKPQFFQYWYHPRRLAGYVNASGLRVVKYGGGDLLYCLYEMGMPPRDNALTRLVAKLEDTALARFGAQSFTISVKTGPRMHCFLCGEQKVEETRLEKFYLPICAECEKSDLARHYRHEEKPRFHAPWEFRPPAMKVQERSCKFCGDIYKTTDLFEDYGFFVPVCDSCLRLPAVNLQISNQYLRPIWRMRPATP